MILLGALSFWIRWCGVFSFLVRVCCLRSAPSWFVPRPTKKELGDNVKLGGDGSLGLRNRLGTFDLDVLLILLLLLGLFFLFLLMIVCHLCFTCVFVFFLSVSLFFSP